MSTESVHLQVWWADAGVTKRARGSAAASQTKKDGVFQFGHGPWSGRSQLTMGQKQFWAKQHARECFAKFGPKRGS